MILKKLFIFLILVTLVFAHSCKKGEVGVKAKFKEITEFVYASVSVKPVHEYQLRSATSGLIQNIFVEVGDSVKLGQKIAQIKADVSEANLKSANLQYQFSKERYQGNYSLLKSLEDDISMASALLSFDSLNFIRQENLNKKGIGAKVEFDKAKLKYNQSKYNLANLKSKYNQTKISLGNELKLSVANAQKAKINRDDYFVVSTINGKVYELYKEIGEMVNPQEPFAQIGQMDSFLIEMMIDEVDVVKVQEGQDVLILLEAYPKKVFNAKITNITPIKDKVTQTFKVEAVFVDAPKVLYSGLSGEANIVVSKREAALVLPIEYLMEGSKVKTENGEINVESGIKNLEYVEIVSGLDTNDLIYKP